MDENVSFSFAIQCNIIPNTKYKDKWCYRKLYKLYRNCIRAVFVYRYTLICDRRSSWFYRSLFHKLPASRKGISEGRDFSPKCDPSPDLMKCSQHLVTLWTHIRPDTGHGDSCLVESSRWKVNSNLQDLSIYYRTPIKILPSLICLIHALKSQTLYLAFCNCKHNIPQEF